jgi:hypothetical protein
MDCQTTPCEASSGVLGSPLMPNTARTVSPIGLRLRPNKTTVDVVWPGIYAPEVSMTCVRSILGVTDAPLCGHGEECLTGDEIPVRIETRRFPLNPLLLEFLPVAADPHAAEV